jgi:hypothetical protein
MPDPRLPPFLVSLIRDTFNNGVDDMSKLADDKVMTFIKALGEERLYDLKLGGIINEYGEIKGNWGTPDEQKAYKEKVAKFIFETDQAYEQIKASMKGTISDDLREIPGLLKELSDACGLKYDPNKVITNKDIKELGEVYTKTFSAPKN